MENIRLKVIGFWAMALILLVETMIIIRWVIEFVTWSSLDSGWAQAIGSIAAIGGAVWIFRTDSAIRHRESKVVALLAASKFGWHAFT